MQTFFVAYGNDKGVEWPFSNGIRTKLECLPHEAQDSLYDDVKHWVCKHEHAFSSEVMDSLMTREVRAADSIMNLTPVQTQIFRFFETGCGVCLTPMLFTEYKVSDKFRNMPGATFRYYHDWYVCNRKYISREFVHFYLQWMATALYINKYDTDDDSSTGSITRLVERQKYSLHCMFQWYVQGGDTDKLPPDDVIDICDVYMQ